MIKGYLLTAIGAKPNVYYLITSGSTLIPIFISPNSYATAAANSVSVAKIFASTLFVSARVSFKTSVMSVKI